MFSIKQIIFYCVCVFGVWVFGFPFASLFAHNRENKKDVFPLSFLMGTAQIILLSYWFSFFNMPMKYIIYFVWIIDAGVWVFVFHKKLINVWSYFNKHNIIILGLCFAAGSLALIPMVVFKACFPYGDGYTYLCIADFLVDKGYSSEVILDQYFPWLTQIYLYQVANLRMGAQFLLAFWTAILNQEYSLLVYAPVSGLGVLIYGMSIWYFTSLRQENTGKDILYAVVFSVFNVPIIIWSAIFGFFPQLFGLTFMIVSLKVILGLMKNDKDICIMRILEAAIFIAVMALCYSEIVPFFVLALLLVYIYEAYNRKAWWKHFKVLLIMAVVSALLMGTYFIKMILGIIAQFGAVVGGEQTINWFGYIAYWFSSVPVGYNFKANRHMLIFERMQFVVVTLLMIFMLVVGFLRSKKADKYKHLQEGAIMSVPYFLMLVYFSCVAKNPFGEDIGNSWSIYKLAQYYFVIVCCYLFVFYSDTFSGKNKVMKILKILFPVIFCIGALMNTVNYSYNVTRPMYEYVGDTENPIDEYMELARMYENENKVINLVSIPDTPRKFITYILRKNKLTSTWSTDGYFGVYGVGMDPQYDMNGITLKYEPRDEKSVGGMIPIDINYIDIQDGTGVGTLETDGMESWTWNDESSTYTVINNTQSSDIKLSFETACADNDANNMLEVYVEDKCVASENVNGVEKKEILLDMEIKPNESVQIRLEYKGKKSVASLADSRELAISVWNIKAYIENKPLEK